MSLLASVVAAVGLVLGQAVHAATFDPHPHGHSIFNPYASLDTSHITDLRVANWHRMR